MVHNCTVTHPSIGFGVSILRNEPKPQILNLYPFKYKNMETQRPAYVYFNKCPNSNSEVVYRYATLPSLEQAISSK